MGLKIHILKDGSGTISIEEIKEMFGSYGHSISDKVWKEIILEVDENEDGQAILLGFVNLKILDFLCGVQKDDGDFDQQRRENVKNK